MKPLLTAVCSLLLISHCFGQSAFNGIVAPMQKKISATKNHSSISDLAVRPGKLPKGLVSFGETSEAKLLQNVLQKMDSLIIEEISEETGQLQYAVKDVFSYSNQGLLSAYVESEWLPEHGKWINSYQDNYTYDEAGNCLTDISSYWNEDNFQWEYAYKWDYTYSTGQQMIMETGYIWDPGGSEWIIDYKDEYTYLTNEMVSTRFLWNSTQNAWVAMFKMQYLFNAEGNLIQSTSFSWDVITEEWLNLNQIDHYYTPEQKPETIISRFWDMEVGDWSDSNKEEFLYGSGGDMLLHTYYEWDSFSELWTETGKEENIYNQQYSYEDLLIPELFEHNEYYFNHMLTQLLAYEYTGLTYSFVGSIKFYYSEIILTGIGEREKTPLICSPNPANETVTFYWPGSSSVATLEIYNSGGQRVYNDAIRKDIPVPNKGLKDGIYICRVTVGQHLYRQKIIIKKQ